MQVRTITGLSVLLLISGILALAACREAAPTTRGPGSPSPTTSPSPTPTTSAPSPSPPLSPSPPPTATPSPSPTVSPTPTPPPTPAGEVTVTLTATSLSFNPKTITVPAGSRVKINFENQDSPLIHNFALFRDSSATQSIFVGESISARSATYEFVAPTQPGTYYFRCNFHAASMNGGFVVR